MIRTKYRWALIALVALSLLATVALAGCGNGGSGSDPSADAETPAPIRIGTLPTEDTLPLWVAEDKGYFSDENLPKVEIITFQSAQERDAALTAGAIDAFMGDIIAATNLEAAGEPVTIVTLMLGATPDQGRFGIVSAPTSGTPKLDLADFAGVPIGTSSATIQEYVLDGLMKAAGVPQDQIKKEEVKKVPIRFELLMQGKLKAAALPEPFLSLAEAQGATLLADDTTGENLSQTVLVIADEYFKEDGAADAVDGVLSAWDRAVADINADPEAYREMLVEKARLPEPLKDTYRVNVYPTHQLPSADQVDAVIGWMKERGYLKEDITYEDLTVVAPS